MSLKPEPRIKWVFSPAHLRIMSWWAYGSPVSHYEGIILDGTVRSGKTLPGSCSFVLWSFDRFREPQQFLLCGKTIGALRRNVVKPLKQAAASIGVRVIEKRADNLLQVTDTTGVCHEFVMFGGNDEGSQDLVQGFTGAGAFFDEAPLMPGRSSTRCSRGSLSPVRRCGSPAIRNHRRIGSRPISSTRRQANGCSTCT